jgi:chorismate mutase-like protein
MSTTPQASADLAPLRVQIDDIDQQLLDLLNRRARVAEQVGEVKKREGTPFFRPDRVAQVIQKMESANTGPLKNAHVSAIWREIMSACLALESPQRVAVLGPAGTFCEEAAIQYFGGAADLMYCNSFDEVFHATAAGSAQYGVVARDGCPSTCRTSSAAPCPAMPKAPAWRPWTRKSPAWPVSARPSSSACMWWPMPSRTTPTTARASP